MGREGGEGKEDGDGMGSWTEWGVGVSKQTSHFPVINFPTSITTTPPQPPPCPLLPPPPPPLPPLVVPSPQQRPPPPSPQSPPFRLSYHHYRHNHHTRPTLLGFRSTHYCPIIRTSVFVCTINGYSASHPCRWSSPPLSAPPPPHTSTPWVCICLSGPCRPPQPSAEPSPPQPQPSRAAFKPRQARRLGGSGERQNGWDSHVTGAPSR